jgi:hypothetical protein
LCASPGAPVSIIEEEKTVVKLPGGSGRLLSGSLNFIFATFPPETILYPGHGDSILLRDTEARVHQPRYRRENDAGIAVK